MRTQRKFIVTLGLWASLSLSSLAYASQGNESAKPIISFEDCLEKATAKRGANAVIRQHDLEFCRSEQDAAPLVANPEIKHRKDSTENEKLKASVSDRFVKIYKLIDIAESKIRESLKDPDSAVIEWNGQLSEIDFKPDLLGKRKFGFGGCGYVNAKNSFGAYAGKRRFVIIFSSIDGGIIYYKINTGNDFDFTEASCSKIYSPPLPPRESIFPKHQPSDERLVGEIEALVRLRDSGALTQTEFEIAKIKILGVDKR